MSFTVPTLTDAAFFSLRTRLDDADYTLEFKFSTRSNTYSLTLLDEEDRVLIAGLKILTGVPLFWRYQHDPRIPRGDLIPITLGADDTPSKFGELGEGKRVELTYYSESELAEMVAAIDAAQVD